MFWVSSYSVTLSNEVELTIEYFEIIGQDLNIRSRTAKSLEEFAEWYEKNKLL